MNRTKGSSRLMRRYVVRGVNGPVPVNEKEPCTRLLILPCSFHSRHIAHPCSWSLGSPSVLTDIHTFLPTMFS